MPPILYISGALPNSTQEQQVRDTQARLLSCHGSYLGVARRFLRVAASTPEWRSRPLMLDSGAFSAWKTGKSTSLDEVTRHYDEIIGLARGNVGQIWLINLDVIPGESGRDPTVTEIADAIVQSDRNLEILKKRFGDVVLPVFHQGEDLTRLDEVCAQAQYIGVSPRNDVAEPRRIEWSQRIHAYLARKHPHVKTHGLAATGFNMFTKVPWYSVDSASWIMSAAYGAVMLFQNGRLNVIGLSERSPRKGEWDTHIDNMPKSMQDEVWAILDKSGFTRQELLDDGIKRATSNIQQMYAMQQGATRKDTVLQESLF